MKVRCDLFKALDCPFDQVYNFDVYRPSKLAVKTIQMLPKFKIDVKSSDPCKSATVNFPKRLLLKTPDSNGVKTAFKYSDWATSSDAVQCPIQDVYYKPVPKAGIVLQDTIDATLFSANLAT